MVLTHQSVIWALDRVIVKCVGLRVWTVSGFSGKSRKGWKNYLRHSCTTFISNCHQCGLANVLRIPLGFGD